MDIKNNPIGFFDSGVGGLSVMREAISIMPNENYIYFGDSKNAPYGTKELDEVKRLTFNAVDFLCQKNVKAVVIACNTATSAAIEDLRNKYTDIPIIGIEPALKPAVGLHKNGSIIIMATPMTLREKKFKELMIKYDDGCEIVPMPCPKLVEFVENGILEGEELEKYLKSKLKDYIEHGIGAIVLGCTHYPFIKATLAKVVGSEIPLIDGGAGTSHELQRKLEEKGTISDSKNIGNVEIYNSTNDMKVIDFCYNLINV
ncbi:glutamate racemase [Clostridium butyricum]|uniref:Glutamate racemase n=1 Tax=Clostridium butyricum TaxID=1492 RepID=A0A6L9EJV8_CLOBU|nr:glutamate racemase [Clostridium butyricum]